MTTTMIQNVNYASLLLLPLLILVHANQTIVEGPSSMKVLLGGDVLLKCTVQNQAGAVQWTKNGFGLGTDRNLAVFERYAMVGSSSEAHTICIMHTWSCTDEYHLQIRNVQLEDDGDYQCQLMATATQPARLSAASTLTVLDSPQVVVLTNRTALDQPADVPLREGDGVLMQCDVRAKPADNVHLLWYRDGVPIKHANTRMLAVQRICQFTFRLTTNHICVGTSIDARRWHSDARMRGRLQSTGRGRVDENGSATSNFACRQQVCFSWPQPSHATHYSYTIPSVRSVHQGVYACSARTPTKERVFEPVRREIAVLISGPPRVRLHPTDGTIGGQAEMRCHVYGYPFPTDVEVTTEVADSVINTLHIKDVRLEDFGEYNCSARNQYGLDSAVGQLAQLDAVPLYLLVPGVIAGDSDVTVKVEALDGRSYPDMYGTSPLMADNGNTLHVTYGKDYMAIPQDNPDLDLLPPPYLHHYAQLNGQGVYSSVQRLSNGIGCNNNINSPASESYGHHQPHLVHMTYLSDGPATTSSMSARDGEPSPTQLRHGRVLAPLAQYSSAYSNTNTYMTPLQQQQSLIEYTHSPVLQQQYTGGSGNGVAHPIFQDVHMFSQPFTSLDQSMLAQQQLETVHELQTPSSDLQSSPSSSHLLKQRVSPTSTNV
ncbi:unnamed protein product [Sphagnum balticum]